MPNKYLHPPTLLLLFLMGFHLWTGWRSVDFGFHWDEYKLVDAVKESVRTGVLLPRWYNYPSLSYDIAAACAVPEVLGAVRSGGDIWRVSENAVKEISKPAYLLRLRKVFYLFATLSLLWVYLAVWQYGGNAWKGLLTAALLGGSWELAYHARWVAPDVLLLHFGALFAYLLSKYIAFKDEKWLYAAVIAAAFACGSKYFGGLFLLTAMAAYAWDKPIIGKLLLAQLAKLTALFMAVFLLVTPGALIEPLHFLYHVRYEIWHYQLREGGHGVAGFGEHLGVLGNYLAVVVFSKYWQISLFSFGLMGLGIVFLLKQFWTERKVSTPLLLFLSCFAFVFYIAFQHQIYVRNYLLFFPFMAMWASEGVYVCVKLFRHRGLSISFLLLFVALCLLPNYLYLFHSSDQIRQRQRHLDFGFVEAYISQSPQRRFSFSPPVMRNFPVAPYQTENPTHHIFISTEFEDLQANHPGIYALISPCPEVNFDYYPGWKGDPKFVCVPIADTAKLFILRQ